LKPDPHPRLLGLVLQPDPLKHGSCKFNIICIKMNIANIIIDKFEKNIINIEKQP
jgi:hypothetical protein